MFDLARFREAQEARPGFVEALAELRAGAKTGHWIWYVFPQLRGLGQSSMAVRFGLDGLAEARAYLADAALTERLATATAAVRAQVTAPAGGVPLETLMGSEIDVLKLVSCLTLFSHLARAEQAARPRPPLAALADDAEAILAVAAAAGIPRCAFTAARIAAEAGAEGKMRA
ncbi:MAG TPA: DUF1810 family protein [Polyangia bacterium]|nr:DUF1810 family protein [Polyangia bacterium]